MTEDGASSQVAHGWPRRWRGVWLTAAGVVAAAAVVLGGAMIGVLTRPSARSAPSATYYVRYSAGPMAPTGRPAMTTSQIVRTLRSMLPARSAISYVQGGGAFDGQEGFEADYNDGQGNVDFGFTIQSRVFDALTPMNCAQAQDTGPQSGFPPPAGGLRPSCVVRKLADGSTEQDLISSPDESGYYVYQVVVKRPDGVEVIIKVANSYLCRMPAGQTGSSSGSRSVCPADPALLPRPPGTIAQWEAIAESSVWRL